MTAYVVGTVQEPHLVQLGSARPATPAGRAAGSCPPSPPARPRAARRPPRPGAARGRARTPGAQTSCGCTSDSRSRRSRAAYPQASNVSGAPLRSRRPEPGERDVGEMEAVHGDVGRRHLRGRDQPPRRTSSCRRRAPRRCRPGDAPRLGRYPRTTSPRVIAWLTTRAITTRTQDQLRRASPRRRRPARGRWHSLDGGAAEDRQRPVLGHATTRGRAWRLHLAA